MAVLAGAAALCLFTMKAGNGGTEIVETEHTGAVTALLNVLEESLAAENELGEQKEETETELISIQVVDEWPSESELETWMPEEESENSEESGGIIKEQLTRWERIPSTAGLMQQDGSAGIQFGDDIWLNTARFFIPGRGIRSVPGNYSGQINFVAELYDQEEEETKRLWDEIDMSSEDYADFNGGIDVTRELVAAGFLHEEITKLLDRFPEIHPHERAYTLRLVKAGSTFRQEDQTGWWDVDYVLSTRMDNGEELQLVYVDIYRLMGDWHDVNCRMDVSEDSLWTLLADPAEDKGRIWVQQIRGDTFADEASVRQFVSRQGAETVLPDGVESEIAWNYSRQELFYYDWMICQGETADYTVVLAMPLMEKQEEGYYLAGRIGREVADKTDYQNLLSAIMQTFQGEPYLHVVKEGECLSRIAEKYCGAQEAYPQIGLYDEGSGSAKPFANPGSASPFANPDLIYPGQKVMLPTVVPYDARKETAANP